jgi:prophage regulatory protein
MGDRVKAGLSIVRRKQLEERCGLARSTIYDRINPNSPSYDPAFPKPVDLGGGRAVGWIESEVEDWLAARVEQRSKSLAIREHGTQKGNGEGLARRQRSAARTEGAA